jgi:hypothetical protein
MEAVRLALLAVCFNQASKAGSLRAASISPPATSKVSISTSTSQNA